jgi:hypothetical protein
VTLDAYNKPNSTKKKIAFDTNSSLAVF